MALFTSAEPRSQMAPFQGLHSIYNWRCSPVPLFGYRWRSSLFTDGAVLASSNLLNQMALFYQLEIAFSPSTVGLNAISDKNS
jgi:hypothetical protein